MANTVVLERQVLPVGETIFSEGEPGERAYIVESGVVEVFSMKDGKKVVFGTVGKGGIFGEMALIDDKPRMATARVIEASTIIVVSRTMFQEKLARTDPFIRGLLKIFAGNIRAMSGRSFASESAPAPLPPAPLEAEPAAAPAAN